MQLRPSRDEFRALAREHTVVPVWAEVLGDLVLFSPEDRYEVEVQGSDYIMLRERDLHAVAAERIEASTGLYL